MPLPPSVMLAFGSSVVLDEVAVIVSELSGVSASHTPNHLPLTGMFKPVETLGFEVIKGARFEEISSGRNSSTAFSRDAYWIGAAVDAVSETIFIDSNLSVEYADAATPL